MNWDDLKIFLAIAHAKGLKKAASNLGLHHTSCARRIKALEEQMGVRLFDRLTSGYVLTDMGREIFLSADKIQGEVNAIERDILGKDTRLEGHICVTVPNGFATHLLMPDITDFMALYPEVLVEVNMSYAMKDLASREADIAIRHGDHPPHSLAGKRVGRVYASAYASKAYLRGHDPVGEPEGCRWIGWGDAANHLNWAEKKKFSTIPVRGDLYSDVLQLAAIKAGMGIASLPCFIGDGDAEVLRIPGAQPVPGDWIWVLAHRDMMANAKVRAFMEFIGERFALHRGRLKGEANASGG
jgi:DNA-binding transcriptional LysR family regulator